MKAILKALAAVVFFGMASTPAWAQDQIDVSNARVYDSPADMMRWRQTCTITEVTFRVDGFPVNADCLEGRGRWPDVIPAGWDGPIQFTYGICLKASDGRWDCSAVVQAWYRRFVDHPEGTAAPYALNTDWFYDCSRWRGDMCSRNPLPGEKVGLFVVRGNARGGAEPTKILERSNVALVTWGQNYVGLPGTDTGAGAGSGSGAGSGAGTGTGGGAGAGAGSGASDQADMSDLATLIRMSFKSDQGERMFADIVARMVAHEKQMVDMQAELDARIDRNGLETFLKDKRVQAIGAAAIAFFSARSQTLGSGQPANMSSAVAAASGLAVLAIR